MKVDDIKLVKACHAIEVLAHVTDKIIEMEFFFKYTINSF